MKIFKHIVNVLKIIILFLYTLILSILGGILLLTREGEKKYLILARHWAKTILKICKVRVQIKGLEKIKNPRCIVYLANHASMFDIWALQAYLPGQIRFVGKQELVRIPIFGWVWKFSGNIPIDRRNPKAFIKSLEKAYKTITDGNCIILFPEGTRTRNGKLQDFKRGPFAVALKSKAIIVPITINGSYSILTKGSLSIRPGLITLIIHDPIYLSADVNKKEYEIEIMKTVKEKIASAYIDQ